MLIAAPFRTSRTQGAILIYPREEGVFNTEEKALVAAIAGFGAVAVAQHTRGTFHATAAVASAHEMHQSGWRLPANSIPAAISSMSFRHLWCKRRIFLASGAALRCFGREWPWFQVRYAVEKGDPKRVDTLFPEGVATKALRAKEVFWTDEASRAPWASTRWTSFPKYKAQQFLAVSRCSARAAARSGNVRCSRSAGRHRQFAGGHSACPGFVESSRSRRRSSAQPSPFGATPPPCRGH